MFCREVKLSQEKIFLDITLNYIWELLIALWSFFIAPVLEYSYIAITPDPLWPGVVWAK